MFETWITEGEPAVFWVSGFYFTHSFLAGIKQNFARAGKHAYDRVDFEFRVQKRSTSEAEEKPKEGCLIQGLYLEGAGWDDTQDCLAESVLKVIHVKMPSIHLVPVLDKA